MFYYLFNYLDKVFNLPGAGVFQYISFRAGMAALLSLLITIIYGKTLIRLLIRFQVGETIRDLGLEGQKEKQGTPTMGGIIIIAAIVLPTLLFAKLDNVYVLLLVGSALWLGFIGFLDDYVKVFKKPNSWLVSNRGIKGKYKVFGQVGLGFIVGLTLYFNKNVVVRVISGNTYQDVKSMATTVPFFKNNSLDYEKIMQLIGLGDFTWLFYVLVATFIITAVSNGANITDGLDGLAAGISAIIGLTLGVLAYLSGNFVFAKYLNIMFIPNLGELVIFCTAFTGACIGFLWYNAFPARVFMGDVGSLSLGGIIAVLALCIRKELLIPVLCGVFLVENLSVIIQVSYFKYTKKKYGEGRRIFRMAPLHHHYQKLGYHEATIVTRFWIVGILLAIITLATLKLR
ncbi:MAG: phospho-N-acetylmuramoyl-pentapeptide-transferase [Microscillaceae bacterium]|nr:phospho-N-acetylmuramoyl-pentapeptide-transferase [Microscillaceae bacterium]MDW8461948.1 phospho-N-acetylmuramoyl-pentapeptide-transferase [Cytophagales bacterium]